MLQTAKVPHHGLALKLVANGICGNALTWIENWLCGRKKESGDRNPGI